MKIFLFIPVVYPGFIEQMLTDVFLNTVIPDSVTIIDNSENGLDLSYPVKMIRPDTKLGVNASWNLGIKKALEERADLISIFNDDLLIEKFFFEKLLDTVKRNKKMSVFCPRTLRKMRHYLQIANKDGYQPGGFLDGDIMTKREGWAWTMKSSVAVSIPPIPETIETFFGDDWYWHHCYMMNRPWYKMKNTWCYHFVGQTVTRADVRKNLDDERETFVEEGLPIFGENINKIAGTVEMMKLLK